MQEFLYLAKRVLQFFGIMRLQVISMICSPDVSEWLIRKIYYFFIAKIFVDVACPVLLGQKWIGNKWVGYNAQWNKRKCQLNPYDAFKPIRDFQNIWFLQHCHKRELCHLFKFLINFWYLHLFQVKIGLMTTNWKNVIITKGRLQCILGLFGFSFLSGNIPGCSDFGRLVFLIGYSWLSFQNEMTPKVLIKIMNAWHCNWKLKFVWNFAINFRLKEGKHREPKPCSKENKKKR